MTSCPPTPMGSCSLRGSQRARGQRLGQWKELRVRKSHGKHNDSPRLTSRRTCAHDQQPLSTTSSRPAFLLTTLIMLPTARTIAAGVSRCGLVSASTRSAVATTAVRGCASSVPEVKTLGVIGLGLMGTSLPACSSRFCTRWSEMVLLAIPQRVHALCSHASHVRARARSWNHPDRRAEGFQRGCG